MATRRRVVEQHEDWLNLTDAEAPWFSLPVLKRVLPNGLDPTPPEVRAEHKARWYGHADVSSARLAEDRTDYLDWLLGDVLGWRSDYLTGGELPAGLADGVTRHDVTITPSGVYQPAVAAPVGLFEELTAADTTGGSPAGGVRLVVFALPAGTDPRTRPTGDTWPATWVQRAALSCRHHRVPLALVTDGDHLTLVHAPEGGATGWGTWRASEFATEPVLLDSFRSMLHSRRFIGVSPQDTPEALLVESAGSQAEVTDQLGSQVRRATELLVNAISRANQDRDGALLAGVAPHEVYEAAVTVMMRTVFLLVAEENDLLPVDNRHYQDLYAVRTLRESLQRERFENPEVLETRTAAWRRLLATSRAVHSGVHHDELSVPAYGGDLFDPDRFPLPGGPHHQQHLAHHHGHTHPRHRPRRARHPRRPARAALLQQPRRHRHPPPLVPPRRRRADRPHLRTSPRPRRRHSRTRRPRAERQTRRRTRDRAPRPRNQEDRRPRCPRCLA